MSKVCLFILSIILSLPLQAKNLGTIGKTWPIAEEDFLVFVHQKLAAMQADGSLAKKEQQVTDRVRQDALNLAPVSWLTTTVNPSVFYYDPTFTVTRTLTNEKGHVFARKGQRINPLTLIVFHETLWFIDARDHRQLAWLKSRLPHFKHNKIILTGGSIATAYHTLKQRIYFDQKGLLSKKFGLTHVPDQIISVGKRLKIQEFDVVKATGRTS